MKTKSLSTYLTLLLLSVFVSISLKAQVTVNFSNLGKGKSVPAASRSAVTSKMPAAKYVKSKQPEKKWDVAYNHTGVKHGSEIPASENDSIKAAKTLNKIADQQKTFSGQENEAKQLVVNPNVALDFQGNAYNEIYPPDNHIAVSDNGYIVSVANSSVLYANSSGTILDEQSLGSFFEVLELSGIYYDPRVIYDPSANKFIMVALSGNTPSNTNVVVAFSQTENPTDGWWLYRFSGDPHDGNSWFDFPSIGVSTTELYISGNLYDANNDFVESFIFQIQKNNGYTGGSIDWNYWYNITDADGVVDFNLTPISFGFDDTLGPGIFFISSYFGDGNDVMVYYTTGTINDNPSLEVYSVDVPEYALSGNGLQLGTSDQMNTNDCRMQSGFYADGIIHFVMNTERDDGYTGIYYGRVDVQAATGDGRKFGLEGYEYAYPSVAPFTTSTTDKTVLISFLRTGANIYPEFRVVSCDGGFNWSSSVLVRQGDSYVDVASETLERWGDYSGISRRHLNNSVEVWVAGCFGENNINGYSNVLNTWIGKITAGAVLNPPVADFTANQTVITVGDQVNFTDLSSNSPTNWSWTFSGGTPGSSSAQNPIVSYNTPGTYTVSLTATNGGGSDTETKVNYITVLEDVQAPVANFTASQTVITEGDQVNFTDLSSNSPTNWSWSFPGGNPTGSSAQHPSVTYFTPGTYNVTLVASNSGGSDTETKVSYITVLPEVQAPVADFTASQTVIYEGEQIVFTDLSTNSPTNWTWSFPGGNPGSAAVQNPSVTYFVAGTYNVTLTASNSGGSDTETKVSYITVLPEVQVPVADFTASQTTIYEGEQITFTDLSSNSPTSWAWSFPGGSPGTSTVQNPIISYTTAGTYDVTLIATNSAGSDTEVKNLYITVLPEVQIPVADFTADQTMITAGQQVNFTDLSTNSPTSWVWSFPGGAPGTSTIQNPSVTYNTPGTYDVTLVASNSAGNDTENKVMYITVMPEVQVPEADFSASQVVITEGEQITFTDLSTNSPTNWVWSFPGGIPNTSMDQNPVVTYNSAGTFDVTLIASNTAGNDTEVKSMYITVIEEVQVPEADFSANQTVVTEGQQVIFTDLSTNNPTGWVWSFPGGTPGTSTDQNPVVTYNSAGTYDVTLVASNSAGNDAETKTFYITVNAVVQAPEADFIADQTIVTEGEQVTFTDLSANNPTSWVWSYPGGTPGTSTDQNPVITYNTAGTYDVTLVATNSEGNDTETKTMYITVNTAPITPEADFMADQTVVTEGDQVSFTDLSANNPTSWVWSFPGGTPGVSTDQNPVITYNVAGSYDVTLVATNSEGNDTETKTFYITVNATPAAPEADFMADQTVVTEGSQVNFTDLSINNPTSWVWSFPGGSPGSSTDQHPVVTYNTAGTYDVTLVASNSVGNDTETKTFYITVNQGAIAPEAEFMADQTVVSEGSQVSFTDLSTNNPTNWVWSFPGGTPGVSTDQHPVITYNVAGTYDVTLVASNSAGNDTETKTFYITVNAAGAAPEADFVADQTILTEGGQVNFTDLSTNNPTGWVWSFPGGMPGSSTDQNPMVTYNTAGTYDVTLVASNSAGNDTETKTLYITVNNAQTAPEADFMANQTVVTEGDQVSFTDLSTNNPNNWVWSFPGGTPGVSTDQNPVITYNSAGTYDVTLVASNAIGNDTETKTFYIIVNAAPVAPEADFVADQTVVSEGGQVSFTDLSANNPTNWVWSFAGGTPGVSTDQNPVITYNTAGTFDVTLVASNAVGNDTETKLFYITVNAPLQAPEADFTADQTIITAGDQVSFTDLSSNAPTSWVWSFPGGTPGVSTNQNPVITYNTPGTYDVTLVASNAAGNDTEEKTFFITVNPEVQAPVAAFEADNNVVVAGGIVQFTDLSTNNPTAWVWSFPGGTPNTSNLQNPIIVYSTPGIYDVSLVVSNAAGNNAATEAQYIEVTPVIGVSEAASKLSGLNIYPNPSASDSRITVEFDLSETMELDFYILDNTGKVVKHLLHSRIKAGGNRVLFNTGLLPAGLYHIIIQDQKKENLIDGKIVIMD
jgi:PKD repeat protein